MTLDLTRKMAVVLGARILSQITVPGAVAPERVDAFGGSRLRTHRVGVSASPRAG